MIDTYFVIFLRILILLMKFIIQILVRHMNGLECFIAIDRIYDIKPFVMR